MPKIYQRVKGTWTEVKSVYQRTGGTWTEILTVWQRVAGTWVKVFSGLKIPGIITNPELTGDGYLGSLFTVDNGTWSIRKIQFVNIIVNSNKLVNLNKFTTGNQVR